MRVFSQKAKDTQFFSATEYALFSGGKRFRPLLCYSAGKGLGVDLEKLDGLALAIEFIHSYSLVHDDLPCMDNDDMRRGLPTTHKKFDETTALLAGDALLTEAFGILAHHYQESPAVATDLVKLLAMRAGGSGMILGQVLDLAFFESAFDEASLREVHLLKTGGLISICIEGAGVVAGVDQSRRDKLKTLGYLIGLAFQIKDDLLDVEKNESQSFVRILGFEGTENFLNSISSQAREIIDEFSFKGGELLGLINYNDDRKH